MITTILLALKNWVVFVAAIHIRYKTHTHTHTHKTGTLCAVHVTENLKKPFIVLICTTEMLSCYVVSYPELTRKGLNVCTSGYILFVCFAVQAIKRQTEGLP